MKKWIGRRKRGYVWRGVAVAAGFGLRAGVYAGDFAWDPGNNGNGGQGTWNLTSSNFDSGTVAVAGNANVKWVNGADITLAHHAVFLGTGAKVTLGTSILVNSLELVASGYTFATGTNSLSVLNTAGTSVANVDLGGGALTLAGEGGTTYGLNVVASGAGGVINLTPMSKGGVGLNDTIGSVAVSGGASLSVTGASGYGLTTGAISFSGATGTINVDGTHRVVAASVGDGGTLINWTATGSGLLVISANSLNANAVTKIGGGSTASGNVRFENSAALGGAAGKISVNALGTAWLNFAAGQGDLMKFSATSTGVLALGADDASGLDFSATGANTPGLRLGSAVAGSTLSGGLVYSGVIKPGGTGYQFGGGGAAVDAVSAGVTTKLIVDTTLADNGIPTSLYASGRDLVELRKANLNSGIFVAQGGGNLYLNHAGAAQNAISVTTSGSSATNFGGLLLNPAIDYLGAVSNPVLDNGAIGWSGDHVLAGVPGTFSGNTVVGTAGVTTVKILNLGGFFSLGTMSQNGIDAIGDDGAIAVEVVKSGAGSVLDLSNAPAGGNLFTGGLHISGGVVVFSKVDHLGSTLSGAITGAGGVLKLKAGSGAVSFPAGKVIHSLGVTGTDNLNGFGIDVSAGDTLTYTNSWEEGQVGRNAYIKTGGGTFEYLPATLVTSAGVPMTYGLNLQGGRFRINQLPYRNQANAATGILEFRGDSTLAVDAPPGSQGGLANYVTGCGFQQLSVYGGVAARIELLAGATMRVTGRQSAGYTFVGDGATLVVQGAGATNGSRFEFGRNSAGGAVGLTGNAGTLDLRDVSFGIHTASANDFWPGESGFGLKLNGAVFNGGLPGIGGVITHAGNFVVNEQVTATRSEVNGLALVGNGNTSWRGTLERNGSNAVSINRSGGLVSVAPGATLAVTSGTTVSVGGTADPFTDSAVPANRVGILNDGAFTVTNGAKGVGFVKPSGASLAGALRVMETASLSARQIRQDSLEIDSSGSNSAVVTLHAAAAGW